MRLPRFSAVLLAALVASCGGEKQQGEKKDAGFFKAGKKETGVVAVPIASREITNAPVVKGKTVVSDRFEAKAPAAVKVDKISVEEGQQVSQGDPLIKIEDQESQLRLNKARAEQKEAEAGLAEANYLQSNRDALIEQEKLSTEEADGLDERINLYQATLDRAKAEIELLERVVENSQINSPIAGVITKRNVSEGSTVEEGEVMLEVLRLSPIHCVFTVSVQEAASLEKEREMEVRFPSLGDQTFLGEVLSVGGEVGAGKRGVEVKLSIPNEGGVLKGEMEGELKITSNIKKKVLVVAESALFRTERSVYIFKVDGDRVRRIPVDVDEELGVPAGQVALLKGVKEGDWVVSSSTRKLKDGDIVEVEKSK